MAGIDLGLVGLPNVGKSTFFNALTRAGAQVANYPFCTIEPNVGVVPIPDERLKALVEVIRPQKVTPGYLRVVDIAGLVEGAHQGEGLGNRFLAHIREVDAILHVVRCFSDPNVARAGSRRADESPGAPSPRRDVEIVETELLMSDLETVEARLEKARRAAKSQDPERLRELEAAESLAARLQRGLPARSLPHAPLGPAEEALAAELFLLTRKPVLYVANVEDDHLSGRQAGGAPGVAPGPGATREDPVAELRAVARERGAPLLVVAAKLEAELAELGEEEAAAFREELGVPAGGLAQVLQAAMAVLNLVTFYTVKGPETRAWIIPAGTLAPAAAGRIHSDMERGFIRAEVVPWQALVEAGSFAAAREKGWVRSEGRDYVVQDGDVILFRFNV